MSRKRQIRVIGAGFGRTGTLSIRHALEDLGYGPCYHMKAALTRPWHIPFWLRATDGKKVNWKRFFRNYRATIDWPACEFYKELMAEFPEAKVILNIRDAEEWYDSAYKTIYRLQTYFPWWFPKIFVLIQERLIFRKRFQGRFEERDFVINNYLGHIQEVKAYVPAEKLLVYEVTEGWEPLCRFLEVPVPDRPFPHYHETRAYISYIRKVKIAAYTAVILILLGMISVLLNFLFNF